MKFGRFPQLPLNDGCMNVAHWLAGLGLEKYTPAFVDNGVDDAVLLRLDADDLREIGVRAVGHRRRLLDAIAVLRDGRAPDGFPAQPVPRADGGLAPSVGERRQLTMMFVDIVGFTALSARLDPEELREVLRAYQNVMAGEVARFEGIVSRFLGDGVLAYFGFPSAHEDNAERAVCASLAIIEAARQLCTPDGAALGLRIGIATGLVVIGDLIGSGSAREQPAVGETPNLAARLQALAEPGTVVIAHGTRQLIGGLFDFADLGYRRVKGFIEPVRAWRVLGRSRAEGRFEARQTGGLTPLIGREPELSRLLHCWHRARAGEGQIVLVSGEPGIGKSRLIKALLDRLQDEPHTRLHCRCAPLYASSPLYPVIDQLERAAGFTGQDSAEQKLDKLERLVALGTDQVVGTAALLAALLSIPATERYPALQLAAPAQREQTQEALIAQLEGLARRRPALLVFEDAHWSDPSSMELLELAVERLGTWPVLMLVTFRPGFVPPWATRAHHTSIAVNRLDNAQSRAMVEQLAAVGGLSAEAIDQVVEKADGVPLFLEELTKAVLESNLADPRQRGGPLPAFAIPASLQDSLVSRLDRLAPVREVAQTAACLGREFSHALLAAISPLTPPRLGEALDLLVGAELLFRTGDGPDAGYCFKHALVRDVAYATMLHSRRQQLHARIVAVIEERFAHLAETQPQILAQHCAEAGLLAKAIAYWRRAGLAAARRSAMKEAIAQLRCGLELVPLLPDSLDRANVELDLQVALGATMLASKGEAAPEIGDAYRRAQQLYAQTGNATMEPAVLWGLWHFHMNRAELPLARAVAAEHMRCAGRRGSVVGAAVGHRCGLVVKLFAGEFGAALRHLDHIESLTPPPEGCPEEVLLDPWITARSIGTWAILLQGDRSRALVRSQAVLAAARMAARPYMLAVVMHHQNLLGQLAGNRAVVEARTAELLALTKEHGFAHWHATATLLHGWAVASRGALEEGLAAMRHGLAAKQATGSRLKVPYYLGLMADLLGRAGRGGEGLALLDEALARVEASGERWFEAELHRLRGDLLLQSNPNQPEPAAACFAAAVQVARTQGAAWWEARATSSLASAMRAA